MKFKSVDVNFNPQGEYEVTEVKSEKETESQPSETTQEDESSSEEPEQIEQPQQNNETVETKEESIAEEPEDDDEDDEEQDEVEIQQQTPVQQQQEVQRQLPEAVQKYLDFLEDTGGSMLDFVNVNRDFDKMSQDEVIRMFMSSKYPLLDKEDIEMAIEDEFGYDPDSDDERDIRKQKLKKKKFYSEALSDLKQRAEKHKTDLVSSSVSNPEVKEAIEFKRRYDAEMAKQKELNSSLEQARSAQRRSFEQKTKKVFGKDFKGFEVKLGDKSAHYKPNDVKKAREQNLNVNNLLSRFVDNKGNVTDVNGYHKALTIASDPDAFAEYFYELGKVDAIEEDVKESKNIISQKTRFSQMGSKSTNKPKYRKVELENIAKNKGLLNLRDY